MDITYIPMAHGFLYLAAVIDWASRAVLAIAILRRRRFARLWRLSNTMDTGFCIAALDEALARYGTPKVFNTDQSSLKLRRSAANRNPPKPSQQKTIQLFSDGP